MLPTPPPCGAVLLFFSFLTRSEIDLFATFVNGCLFTFHLHKFDLRSQVIRFHCCKIKVSKLKSYPVTSGLILSLPTASSGPACTRGLTGAMPRSYYSDEESIERERVRFRRERSPAPVHYVEPRRETRTSRAYYQDPFLGAQERNMVMTTTRVRERSRERRSPPVLVAAPAPVPQGPVVIKQTFHHDHHHSSDDDSSIGSSSHHYSRRGRPRNESRVSSYSHHHSSHSHSHSRSRAGSDAYLTMERYEMERKLDDTRRQLEALRVSAAAPHHSSQERFELERERERLRRQLEAEQRERDAEAEIRTLRRDKAELDRLRAEEVEEDHRMLIRKELEYRDLRERQAKERQDRELEERRAHDMEDFELRDARRKLQRIEEREKREKEALERAREARTQTELKAAKDELDKSKSNSPCVSVGRAS